MYNKLSNSTRRQVIKSIGVAGFIGVFGASSVKDFIGTARASTDYKDHFQQLTSDHGDLVQTEIADHQKVSSSCFNCGDFPDDGGGGGGGSTETDTPDPTPTPTDEPDPEPPDTPEPNQGPAANISVASKSIVGMSVEMSANNSYDTDGYISSYDWELGDSSTASGENVSHSYNSPGTYTITLTVNDNDGAADQASTEIYWR